MKKKRFIVTQDFRSPNIARDGGAHAPHQVGWRQFKKGEQFNGELIMEGGKPKFAMAPGALMIPLSVVKEVVAKDVILSNAEGDDKQGVINTITVNAKKGASKFKLIDAAIFGALAGFAGYTYAVKKQYIAIDTPKHKMIAIGVTAGIFAYAVYRFSNSTKPEKVAE